MASTSNECGEGSWVFQPLSLVLAVDAVLAFRLFLTISTEAVNIFYWDQWDFNDPILFHPQPFWQAFRHQHGPHRQGLGAFVGLLVGGVSHWSTRADAFSIGIIVVIASLCALWLKKRLFGSLTYSDVIIPMLFFTRVQWETFLGTTNPAHGSLPVLLVVLFGLAWTCQHDILKYPLIVIFNFLAIYTGFGLFLGFVTPALLALDAYQTGRSKGGIAWHAIAACLVSVASIASFFADYARNPDCLGFIDSHPASYLAFVTMMFSGFLAARGLYFSVVSGGIVVAILIRVAIAQIKRFFLASADNRNISAIVLTLISFSLLFSSGTAAGRICIEAGSGQTSRYMIYLAPAFLGIYFYALSLYGKVRTWSIATLLALSLLASFPTGVAHKGTMEKARLDWKNCYLRLEDVERCDDITNFTLYPRPEAATHLQEKLLYLEQHQLNLYAK
jgi:hypothetical protein